MGFHHAVGKRTLQYFVFASRIKAQWCELKVCGRNVTKPGKVQMVEILFK